MSIDIKDIAIQLRDAVNANNGFQKFIYKGSSMNPILKEDDIIVVRNSMSKDLHLGDIVVYKAKDHLVVHRFLRHLWKDDGILYLITKADNSSKLDEPIRYDFVIGKVSEINKNGRKINIEDKSYQMILFVIGAVALLEARLLENLIIFKKRFLKRLKVKKSIKQNVEKLIRIPNRLVLKILCMILMK